jgi:methylphosphotriester-DNA--protein-cysteine methyltransferase
VKVKTSSGIFHVPGGRSYERTNPDRCYATPAAAEADGYRPAKA